MNIRFGDAPSPCVTQRFSEALVAYAMHDIEPIIAMCADDVEWVSCARREDVAFGGRYRGRDQVRQFFEFMAPSMVSKRIVVKDVIVAGDTIVSIIEIVPNGSEPEVKLGTRVVSRWTIQAGMIARFEDYFDVKAALMAHLSAEDALVTEVEGRLDFYKADQCAVLSLALQEFFVHNREPLLNMFALNASFHSVTDAMLGLNDGIRGREAVARRIGGLREAFKMHTFTMVDIIPAGDRVVHIAEIIFNARGALAERARFRVVGFWDFQDGEIVQYREYFDLPAVMHELGRQQELIGA